MSSRKILPSDQPMREIRPVRMAYADIFPPCRQDGCNDIGEGYDQLCSMHASNREFEARLAAKRAARGTGR